MGEQNTLRIGLPTDAGTIERRDVPFDLDVGSGTSLEQELHERGVAACCRDMQGGAAAAGVVDR